MSRPGHRRPDRRVRRGDYAVRPLDEFAAPVPTDRSQCCSDRADAARPRCCRASAASSRRRRGRSVRAPSPSPPSPGLALRVPPRDVGIVFQSFNLVPSLTAHSNVAAPLRGAGVSGAPARARAAELLDHVGLGDRMGHRPAQLSGGQQQRVLAHTGARPRPVDCSSPTSRPPVSTTSRSRACFGNSATSPPPAASSVVATHDDRLLPLADRIIEMVPRFNERATCNPSGPSSRGRGCSSSRDRTRPVDLPDRVG